MKKFILACLTGMVMHANAQTLIVDLNTGRADNWAPPYGWDIPPKALDSTWMVRVPGSGTYHYATVSTGIDENYGRNFQTINYNVHMIAPTKYVYADTTTVPTATPGDLVNLVDSGDYYYRTQFYFDKTCNKVSSAYLHIATLTGGYTITDFLINGYSEAIQTTKLNINYAYSNIPYSPGGVMPNYTIPISSGDLVNGWNSIYVLVHVDPPHHTWCTGLMLEGYLEINYGPVVGSFNLSGSTTSPVCSGQPAYIDVAVGTGQISSQYVLTVTSPTGTVYSGSVPASITVWPSTTTTYSLALTNTVCGTEGDTTITMTVPRHCLMRTRTGQGDVVQEKDLSDEVSIMPNPSSGVFSVNTGSSGTGLISVYDVSGSLLKKIEITNAATEYKIDLGGFPNGIYMLTIDSENGHARKKIIHQQ